MNTDGFTFDFDAGEPATITIYNASDPPPREEPTEGGKWLATILTRSDEPDPGWGSVTFYRCECGATWREGEPHPANDCRGSGGYVPGQEPK